MNFFTDPLLQTEWDKLATTGARVTANTLSDFVLHGLRILNKAGCIYGGIVTQVLLIELNGFDPSDSPFVNWNGVIRDHEKLVEMIRFRPDQILNSFHALQDQGLVEVTRTYTPEGNGGRDEGKRERTPDYWEVRATAGVQATPTEEEKAGRGVSMFDAAMILTDEDTELARQVVDRWQTSRKKTKTPKPAAIGYDPEHSQMKLFAPLALAKWIEEIEGKYTCDEHRLRERLARKAREPR
jgi:hypothetical protein